MALSPIKDLEVHLIRNMQDFYEEIYKTFLDDVEKNLNKWRNITTFPDGKTQCHIVVQYLKFNL